MNVPLTKTTITAREALVALAIGVPLVIAGAGSYFSLTQDVKSLHTDVSVLHNDVTEIRSHQKETKTTLDKILRALNIAPQP